MTVSELIAQLREMPQEAVVYFTDRLMNEDDRQLYWEIGGPTFDGDDVILKVAHE